MMFEEQKQLVISHIEFYTRELNQTIIIINGLEEDQKNPKYRNAEKYRSEV
jgi:hypothetical protein